MANWGYVYVCTVYVHNGHTISVYKCVIWCRTIPLNIIFTGESITSILFIYLLTSQKLGSVFVVLCGSLVSHHLLLSGPAHHQ